MKKILSVLFCVLAFWFGVFVGFIFVCLRIMGKIKVVHPERFPKKPRSILLVCNHPSVLEPFLLYGLYFPDYLFNPWAAPLSAPDLNNFIANGKWGWTSVFLIAVPRGEPAGERNAFSKMKTALQLGRNLNLHPEGGRTRTGLVKGKKCLCSPKGHKICELTEGVGVLARIPGVHVLPVWVSGTDKVMPNWRFAPLKEWRNVKIRFKIGRAMNFNTGTLKQTRDDQKLLARKTNTKYNDRKAITSMIADALLELADEE